jgi:release factor glutamine methyltransferase
MPSLEVWASDISDEALETAKKNAALLLPAGSINFYSGDLYNAIPASSFSLIVCNPPYIPTDEMQGLPAEVRKEPRLALDGGLEGLAVIKRVIDGSVEKLTCGGALLLEADPRQMEKITFFLEKQGFSNIKLYKDLSGKERVIGGIYE